MEAKIDAYIKENPRQWAYRQGMPRDRLERAVVMNEVRQLDHQQRMFAVFHPVSPSCKKHPKSMKLLNKPIKNGHEIQIHGRELVAGAGFEPAAFRL